MKSVYKSNGVWHYTEDPGEVAKFAIEKSYKIPFTLVDLP